MKKRISLFSKIKLLMFLSCLIFSAGSSLFAAEKFKQILKWNDDPNVLEYQVDIQDSAGNIIKSVTTENSTLEIALKEGTYRYRVIAYDLLGREAASTGWLSFDVALAKQPEIEHKQKLEALQEDGKTLEINLNVDDVSADTVAELVNIKTKAKIKGELILAGTTGTGLLFSEVHKANKVRFTDVTEGNWKLVVTNPSGYTTESEVFEVRDVIKEQRLAAQKAEEERLAREKAEQEERDRIAREIAEREEAERLAIQQAKEEEERRIREEEERIAREEQEALEREEEKKRRREAWLTYDRKFNVFAGVGGALVLYDNNFFEDYLEKPKFQPSLNAQLNVTPVHTDRIRFGMELNTFATRFNTNTEFFKMDLNILLFEDDLAFRFGLKNKKVWFQAKAGGGIVILQEVLDYSSNNENNKKDKTRNFGYFTAGGGLSAIFIPTTMFAMEVGVDYHNLFIPDSDLGILNPYLAVGIRF